LRWVRLRCQPIRSAVSVAGTARELGQQPPDLRLDRNALCMVSRANTSRRAIPFIDKSSIDHRQPTDLRPCPPF
jgi:hypothetical protein